MPQLLGWWMTLRDLVRELLVFEPRGEDEDGVGEEPEPICGFCGERVGIFQCSGPYWMVPRRLGWLARHRPRRCGGAAMLAAAFQLERFTQLLSRSGWNALDA
jgi:hypothetical protein